MAKNKKKEMKIGNVEEGSDDDEKLNFSFMYYLILIFPFIILWRIRKNK